MIDDKTVLDAVAAAVEAAKAAGADWADAVAASGRSISVSAERNTIRESESGYYRGVGVRAFVAGGMGLARAGSLELVAARRIGQQAAELARSASPDPDFRCLPEPQPLGPSPKVFDDKVAGLPAETLVDWCVQIIDRGRAAADQVFVGGGAHASSGVWAMASSTGVVVSVLSSWVGYHVFASVWDGEQAASYWDSTGARCLADLQWADLPEAVVKRAASLVHDRPITTRRRDLVLDYKQAHYWLDSVLGSANAESVQRKRSFLVGKEGEQIASPVLTVVEDPFVPGGAASCAFDGEGVPRRKRELLSAGVLTTYLHNSYTANKAGVEYTGHASRRGYHADVGIGMSNVQVRTGEEPLEKLISDVEDGIFLVVGAPFPDSVTGQVSSTIDGGFLIRNGQLAEPVKGALLAGSIFDFLGRIDAVSSDYREEAGAIMPAVRVRDVLVSAE